MAGLGEAGVVLVVAAHQGDGEWKIIVKHAKRDFSPLSLGERAGERDMVNGNSTHL